MTSIGIDIDTKSFRTINRKYLLTIKEAMPIAAKLSLTRGKEKANTEIVKVLKPQLNQRAVKAREIKKKLGRNTVSMLRGKTIERYEVLLKMPQKGFALIRFVVGRKTPASQKRKYAGHGSNKRNLPERKKVRVRIAGRETVLESSYIAKAKGVVKATGKQNYQVYQNRSSGKRVQRASQSIAALSRRFLPIIEPAIAKTMRKKFEFELRSRLRK